VLPATTPASGNALSLSDIRNVIREEIQAELLDHLAQETPSKEQFAPPYKERTEAERQQSYEKASQVLRRSLSYGTWTQEDRREVQSILHELTVPQQDQLIGELFTAIQNGKLKVEGSAPPF
jgi:O-methyltransferase involved in polyketide biosynthesis